MSDKESVRHSGFVKWFNDSKGFGFLILDGINRDVFAHKQQLTKSGVESIKEDDKVSAVVRDGPKGLFAVDIKKIEPR